VRPNNLLGFGRVDLALRETTSEVNLYDLELDAADRCAARRQYRTLRIAVYAPQSYTGPDRQSYQGCYGMERDEARDFIAAFYREVSWKSYLGSK